LQNPEQLGFAASHVEELSVAQVLIKTVKLKCCGIKDKHHCLLSHYFSLIVHHVGLYHQAANYYTDLGSHMDIHLLE